MILNLIGSTVCTYVTLTLVREYIVDNAFSHAAEVALFIVAFATLLLGYSLGIVAAFSILN